MARYQNVRKRIAKPATHPPATAPALPAHDVDEVVRAAEKFFGLPDLELAINLNRKIMEMHLREHADHENPPHYGAPERWLAPPAVAQRAAKEIMRLHELRRELLQKVRERVDELLGERSPFHDPQAEAPDPVPEAAPAKSGERADGALASLVAQKTGRSQQAPGEPELAGVAAERTDVT
jgi:hypothetical protein